MAAGIKTEFDEDLAEKLWFDGLLDREIANHLGVPYHVINHWRNAQGEDMPPNNGIFGWQKDRCRKCNQKCKARKGERCRRYA